MTSIDRKKLILILLVLVLFLGVLLLVLISKIDNSQTIQNYINTEILESNWPSEVPVIQSKFVDINAVSERTWQIDIKEEITYDLFRSYLIEVFDAGFQPIIETGSKSPKYLSTNPPDEDGYFILWSGKNDIYTIEVFWTLPFDIDSNSNSDSELEYEFENCLSIALYQHNIIENVFSGDINNEVLDSGDKGLNTFGDNTRDDADINISGDVTNDDILLEVFNSGDIEIVSGE